MGMSTMQAERSSFSGVRLVFLTPLRWIALWTAVALLAGWSLAAPASAAAKDQPGTKEKEKAESPKPEDLLLRTGDGVQLAVTYYAGNKGKETIPIVLLHGWKQSRTEYKDLALALQAMGHAVLTVDLRGHGESTRRRTPNKDELLDAAKMVPAPVRSDGPRDMKAVKDFPLGAEQRRPVEPRQAVHRGRGDGGLGGVELRRLLTPWATWISLTARSLRAAEDRPLRQGPGADLAQVVLAGAADNPGRQEPRRPARHRPADRSGQGGH